MKQQVRRFSLEELGKGRTACGGDPGRKARLDVLKRMSGLGAGLSTAQKGDFKWFSEAWDAAGMQDFGSNWPETFSVWMQGVIQQHQDDKRTAFSWFMYSETRRRLAEAVALALPPASAA